MITVADLNAEAQERALQTGKSQVLRNLVKVYDDAVNARDDFEKKVRAAPYSQGDRFATLSLEQHYTSGLGKIPVPLSLAIRWIRQHHTDAVVGAKRACILAGIDPTGPRT